MPKTYVQFEQQQCPMCTCAIWSSQQELTPSGPAHPLGDRCYRSQTLRETKPYSQGHTVIELGFESRFDFKPASFESSFDNSFCSSKNVK